MPPKHKVDPKKLEAERLLGFLQELLKEEENKYCADCETKQPRWASWNLGVFLCIRCAGLHRNLGVHISKVKSVNLDSWTAEQVQSMRVMGNAKAKAVYEAELPHMFRRPQSDQTLEAFIRAKYESRRYILKDWQRPVVSVSDLPLHSNMERLTERGSAHSTNKPTSKLQQSVNNAAPISSTSQAPVLIDFFDMSGGKKDSSCATQPSNNTLDDIFGPIVSAPPTAAAVAVQDKLINSSAGLAQPQQQSAAPAGVLVLGDVEAIIDKNSASNADQNLVSESELDGLNNTNFGSTLSAQDSKKSTSDILALYGLGGGSSSNSIILPQQQPPMPVNPAMLSNFVSSAAPQHFSQQQKPMGDTQAAGGGMNGGVAAGVMMSPHMSAPSFAAFQQAAPPVVNASLPLGMPPFSASSQALNAGFGSAAPLPSNLSMFAGGAGNCLFGEMSGVLNGTAASNNNKSDLDDLFGQFKM